MRRSEGKIGERIIPLYIYSSKILNAGVPLVNEHFYVYSSKRCDISSTTIPSSVDTGFGHSNVNTLQYCAIQYSNSPKSSSRVEDTIPINVTQIQYKVQGYCIGLHSIFTVDPDVVFCLCICTHLLCQI